MDTRTTLIAAALTIFANGGILVLIQRLLPSVEQASAKAWQLGTILIAAGCIGFSFKSILPPAFELTAPNALIMFGLAAYWHSVRLLFGQSSRLMPLLAPGVVATATIYIFQIHYPDVWIRILVVALVWMFLMFGSTATLQWHTTVDTPRSQRVLTWLFYVVGLCTVFRLLHYSQIDLPASFDVTDNSHWVTRATPLLALALSVLGSSAFILLCYERIKARARRQTEALGYISHDLRAPAATIRGYVDLLRPSVPAGKERHLQAIERSTDYQISLIDELLEYAKQELKPLRIHAVPMDMEAFIARMLEQGRALCSKSGSLFTISADSALPASISMDVRRLSQVLLNLISNAGTFTREGQVTLSLSCTREGTDALLHFSVQDDGPGIPAARQAHVFDAFEQSEPRDGSVGLGLHIAHGIVHNMGGVLQLESSPGAGARFSFCLRVPVLSAETVRLACETGIAGKPLNIAADTAVPPSIRPQLDDLALHAKLGEITKIEQWLARNLEHHPDVEQFLRQIEQAADSLDLARIEQLAAPLSVQ